jgi:predicted enzyme related to lactoylglutathione lyase
MPKLKLMSKKMSEETNALNWFEIPATGIERAKKFYATIFEVELFEMEMMGMKMAMFPNDGTKGTVGGAIVQSDMHSPSATGSLIYLNANPDLSLVTNRIEKAGGNIIMPKTKINDEIGYMAIFSDTEGNTVGLHSDG